MTWYFITAAIAAPTLLLALIVALGWIAALKVRAADRSVRGGIS